MLIEWFTYLTTACPPLARKLGYLHDSIGLRARYQRCQTTWQPHLQNTRRVLLESIPRDRELDTALILGSGLLLDIPLAELAVHFKRVLLVDVVHLPEVRRRVGRYPHVQCVTHDVTGFLAQINSLNPTQMTLDMPQRFLDDARITWVASVNLLSQLPLCPLDYLHRHFPELDEATLEQWGVQLMHQHLAYLRRFSAPVCLLTDITQSTYNEQLEVIEYTDFSTQFALAQPPRQTWLWDVAPLGEIAAGVGRIHQVAYYQLNGE